MTFKNQLRRRFAGTDRGTMRGAKRVIVTDALQMLDHELAKKNGIKGIFFQSKAEALRWIALCQLARYGRVRHLERQVRYPLHATNPEGLKVKLGNYIADFVYEEQVATHPGETGEAWQWVKVVEDVKGNPEEMYLWKRKHVEAEYGFTIFESKAWARK